MTLVIALFLGYALAAAAPTSTPTPSHTPAPTPFDRLYAAAEELEHVPEAKEYLPKAFAVVGPALSSAMEACSDPGSIGLGFRMVVRITRAGKVNEVRFEPQSALTACVAKHFVTGPVPSPPRSEWLLAIRMAVAK